jgi:2-keto-4-pentenoate hydratase/2-oxohepta-3-ene-1,7-dioic acid hydratase in catechol pathway
MILPGLTAPLRTIYCIGRNYAEHARELGNEIPSEPVVFLKPASSIMLSGGVLKLPARSKRVDHEVELVVAAGPKRLFAVGIDFTARDIQLAAKEKGLPWTMAKGFPGFAAVGPFIETALPLDFSLSVNGETRQKGTTKDMLVPVDKLMDYLGETFGFGDGDIVFTGTPAGVSPLKGGDRIAAELAGGISRLELTVQ